MEFKQLEAFVNVIRYKSFSKAAEATYLTQPTISTHISSLEKELGVKLIDRKGKESRPTKQGRAFYNYAVNIINTRERAMNAMKEFGSDISGSLDIRTSSIPGQVIVPELIAGFHERYPNVSFNVEQSDSDKVWSDIRENLGEIGFTGYFEDNSLKYELLFKDTLVLAAPKNERFLKLRERSDKISIADIMSEKFIWREEGSATRKTFERWIMSHGSRPLETVAVVNSLEGVKACVRKGLGVSVLSLAAVRKEAEADDDMLIFEFEDVDLEREFYMVYNKSTTLSPVASRFKEYVEEVYRG
ncbi:MAG: LysR family transcriptional regulator [Firmicutes bacterium]|nr:LysR family transcriptional regulator [Bacillota bacterium]